MKGNTGDGSSKKLFELHAEVCKVFSSSTRLEILNLLRHGRMSVSELVAMTGLGQANISQHLSMMRSKGMLASGREGKNIYYRLANKKIIRAFDIIREVLAERLESGPVAAAEKQFRGQKGKTREAG